MNAQLLANFFEYLLINIAQIQMEDVFKHLLEKVINFGMSIFFCILLVMSFKEKLENWRTSINCAGSGEELYILLLNYKKFINKNWMDDFGDPGNWKAELNQVISKVRKKVDVVDIRDCQDLSSYKDDARQTAHSLNHTLKYHHSLTKG